jgi:hypothetical protein
MAGDWIKMRCNLWDDPRVSRICDTVGKSEAAVVGALYWLWITCDQHSEDGALPGYTLARIDRKVDIKGFAAATASVGWLVETDEGISIPRFEEHNGCSAKARALTARRVSRHKKKGKGNGEVTDDALPERKRDVSGALPREEKRREEPTNNASTVLISTGKTDAAPKALSGNQNPQPNPQHVAAVEAMLKQAKVENASHNPDVLARMLRYATPSQIGKAITQGRVQQGDRALRIGLIETILEPIVKAEAAARAQSERRLAASQATIAEGKAALAARTPRPDHIRIPSKSA